MEAINNNLKKCEICEEEITNFHLENKKYYCDECYKYIHNKKTKKNHNKGKLDNLTPIGNKCPDHPDNLLNLFCIDEKSNI